MANARQRKKIQAKDVERAFWEHMASQGDLSHAKCSNCGFTVETARAVETGWSTTEYVSVRYRFCPMCGRAMSVHGQK